MLPTESAGYLALLLQHRFLIEDPETGVIQLDPSGYQLLNKPIPATFNNATFKARVDKLIKSYLEIWPAKIMSGNRLVRQGPGAIRKKLSVFLKKYPKYTDDQILAATKKYVDKLRQNNFNYVICSDYFIEKNGVSQLESYIIALVQNAESKVIEQPSIYERTV